MTVPESVQTLPLDMHMAAVPRRTWSLHLSRSELTALPHEPPQMRISPPHFDPIDVVHVKSHATVVTRLLAMGTSCQFRHPVGPPCLGQIMHSPKHLNIKVD